MVSKLNVDYITKRLLALINTDNKSEQDINDIIVHINEKAPQLLEDLSIDSKRRVVEGMQIKYFEDNEVIFRQGDIPDAYYTVIRGSVSIYAQKSSAELRHENTSEQRKQYGNLLVKLGPSSSFGELSFKADGNHSPRNAGVISDGYHDLVQEEEGSDKVGSNVAVLLLIPEKLYLSELFSKHATKHQTNEKISLIEGSILFKHWSMDQKVKLAYAMKRKQYSKGSIVARQGDRRDFLFFINTGILNVVQKMGHSIEDEHFDEEQASNAVRRSKVGLQMVVEIADLYAGDIFSLVEIVTNSKKLKREAIAKTNLELFLVQVELFSEVLQQEKETSHLIEKVSYNRLAWESLRRDYAMKFSPIMPLSLPKSASELSNYCISPLSVLSENEHQRKKRNDTYLARKIRAIRYLLRPQSIKTNNSKKGNINTLLGKAKKMCDEALDLADDEKKLEVNKLIEMIHELETIVESLY